MGLELVEIVMQIEETFDVSLSEDELNELAHDRDIVVGDLYDHILGKLHLRDVARYDFGLNYALWRELQEVLHRVAAVPRDEVELKTPLATLFPREFRRARWDALRKTCPYRVAELDYPRSVRRAGFLLALLMVLFELLRIWQIPGAGWLWPLLGIFGLWMLAETYMKVLKVFAPLRVRFPSGMNTAKDLCRAVLAANYADICRNAELPRNGEMPSDERCLEVWEKLVGILADTLGVKPDQVAFRSRLMADLGAG
jgi:hypothetical protein